MNLTHLQVTVVGLGLMGGSLAGALKGRCRAVVGVDRDPQAVLKALEAGFVDRAVGSLAEGVAEADIVVLATPVRAILCLLQEIGPLAKPGALVMDVGSTKRDIVAAMERLPASLEAIGGHPMCGKERSGIAAAEPGLYQGAAFILTPLDRTSPESVSLACSLVHAVGAHPLLLDPERHDRLVARVSHLPYLLSCALVASVADAAHQDQTLWDVAAAGFRDTSRLAASDVTVMLDILQTNRMPVLEALASLQTQLQSLQLALEAGDESRLREALERAWRARVAWAVGKREPR